MSGYSHETPQEKLKRFERNMDLYITKWNAACRFLSKEQISECIAIAYKEYCRNKKK